ncbi:MAG: hypothetical protein KF832_08675 [Caldilineaceae bacterium]|nr:hypothetical protein [Caldilineaceae bacterium]
MQTNHETNKAGLWGLLLIGAGLFFLLQNLGWFGWLSDFIWVGIFSGGGLIFLYFFLSRRQDQWWAAIPGFTLLGLATVIFLDNLGPAFLAPFSGSVFLGSIGLGFMMVYLANPQLWWAIIPGGVMATLAVVAGADQLGFLGFDTGGLFFLGLGGTFLVLALLSQRNGEQQSWAFIPAAVLLTMGILIGTHWMIFASTLWPLALILAGGYWIWRSRQPKMEGD